MRIVLFLILLLFVILLFAVGNEKLNLKSKIIILVGAMALFLIVFFYNESMQNKEDGINRILEEFMQGKTVTCSGYEVDKKHFNYEYGTQSFVAKREFDNLNAVIIPIEKCMDK
ncbi:hypothetical protein [Campylobacter hyointestinalis]|uniref:hypothetical protein n=1 Tax=Campylobacter hyointestinalis TaxID=198 RepID=UPI000DCF1BEC|nr:hypothetical protein [Campylobacter hyointestinalis]RAZ50756.1 hypothetical protein CHL9004_00370 [Campylobacter hyointestinalis subsp. lawsonii]